MPGLNGAIAPSASESESSGTTSCGIRLQTAPEPGAVRARAVGAVEREVARRELVHRHAVDRARERLRERQLLAVDDRDEHRPLGESQRRLDAVGEAGADALLHDEPVDDDVDVVLVLLVEHDLLVERAHLAVHAHAREALRASGRRRACRTRPCGPSRPARAPGTWCPVPARGCGRRSGRGVCRSISRPQIGQCGMPTRA